MLKHIRLVLALVLLSAFLSLPAFAQDAAMAPDPEPGQTVMVHFLVVQGWIEGEKGGGDVEAALSALKARMIELAGGYTELGATKGGSDSSGSVHHEDNYSFLVAAKGDISAELHAAAMECFNDEGFLLVWPAQRK